MNGDTIYDILADGFSPTSTALAIFPLLNVLFSIFATALFIRYRGRAPIGPQVAMMAVLMVTGVVAYLDVFGYTGRNLLITSTVSIVFLVSGCTIMRDWARRPTRDMWTLKRDPLTLALRMFTIVPTAAASALPIVVSYYAIESGAMIDRTMDQITEDMRADIRSNRGLMSPSFLRDATLTYTWYEEDPDGWKRDIWRLGSFDLGRVVWNMQNEHAPLGVGFSTEKWSVARISFTLPGRRGDAGFPLICSYRNDVLDAVRFQLGGSINLLHDAPFSHLTALCPSRFNPTGAALTDPREYAPPSKEAAPGTRV